MTATATTDRRREWILRRMTEFDRKMQEAEPGSKDQALNMKWLEAWIREAEKHGIAFAYDPETGYSEAEQQAA